MSDTRAGQKIRCVCCGKVYPFPQRKGDLKETLFPIYRVSDQGTPGPRVKITSVYMCADCQQKHNAIPKIMFSDKVWLKAKGAANRFAAEIVEITPYGGKIIPSN
jgi:hypothetical protein